MALWVRWSGDRYMAHGGEAVGGVGYLVMLGMFAVGWSVMTTAMMLPAAAAVVGTFRRVVRRRPDRLLLQGCVISGFLFVWLVIGMLFRVGDVGVHVVVEQIGWLASRPRMLAGTVLAGAGLFQFTNLKNRCLTACRSPRSFVYQHWGGQSPFAEAFRVGAAYGRSCAGCCWALMLLLFGLESASLVWMLVLASIMALEKNRAIGRQTVLVVGVLLVVLGSAVLVDAWPASLLVP